MRSSPLRRVLRAVLLALATPLAGVMALLGLGTMVPRLPWVGTVGSLVGPTYAGPALLAASASVTMSFAANGSRGGRFASALAVVSALATAVFTVVFSDQVRRARRVGAAVTPSVFTMRPSPRYDPDRSETYLLGPEGDPLRIDVYLPANADGAPLMMYVHGGGWIQGAPDDASAHLRWFTDQGYVVVAPEYSLATAERPTWDIAMPQIGEALAWAADHADEWGADRERIVVWGASAGANLALAATYAAAYGVLELPSGAIVPHIRAVAGDVPAVDPAFVHANRDPIWGKATREMVRTYIGGDPDDHPDRMRAIQVDTYLTPTVPPTLITLSAGDHLVPVAGVRGFIAEARSAGANVDVEERPWGDHLISARFHGLPSQTMLRRYAEHFRRYGA